MKTGGKQLAKLKTCDIVPKNESNSVFFRISNNLQHDPQTTSNKER